MEWGNGQQVAWAKESSLKREGRIQGVLSHEARKLLAHVRLFDFQFVSGSYDKPSPPNPEDYSKPPSPNLDLNANIVGGPNIVAALGNSAIGLPPAVIGYWSSSYEERLVEAVLTAFHFRGSIRWSTLGHLGEELFARFGLFVVGHDAHAVQKIFSVSLAAVPPAPLSGASLMSALGSIDTAKGRRVFNALRSHTQPFLVPAELPQRRPLEFAPSLAAWGDHWDTWASPAMWTFAGRGDEQALSQAKLFHKLAPEVQEKLRGKLEIYQAEDDQAIAHEGCSFPDCTYRKRDAGQPNFRPPHGYRCPFAAERGEVQAVCGTHFRLAWAAKLLCRLSEAEYRMYFYKLLEFVILSKHCEGPNCTNQAPPFYKCQLHFVCAGWVGARS